MGDAFTPEQRRRADALVQQELLIGLWRTVLKQDRMPAVAAKIIGETMLGDLERMLESTRGEDAAVTQHLALDAMEFAWRRIRHGLPSLRDTGSP